MKILVVEDDTLIREGLSEFLSESGYSIIQAKDGKEALEKFNTDIHLVILDIQIPYINGLDVLKEIRKESDLPVLILTAFSNEEFKIDAYTNLADGYIEKPFSLPVLKARIDALLSKQDIFAYKNVCVNFKSYTAKIDGKTMDINAKELEILKYLLDNAGIALTRAQILDHVWKDSEEVPYDRVIDVYIKELRKKLGGLQIGEIMKNLKIFPKICIQTFSVIAIIVLFIHLFVYLIFPRTYLDVRKEEIYTKANEITENLNGKSEDYIEQALDFYSNTNEIKAFIKKNAASNEVEIKNDLNVDLRSSNNSLIIEERKLKLDTGKTIRLQFVSTADMQSQAKNLSLQFLPYSLILSLCFSAIVSFVYAKSIKNYVVEIKRVTDQMMALDKKARLEIDSNDEIGQLKAQINDLYETLLDSISNLELKNKEILRLEKIKYNFFKGASHELKTPLASLKIILENMKYNVGKYKNRDVYIDDCIDLVDHLTKSIQQILSVYSIENLKDDEEIVCIKNELSRVLQKYDVLIHQKELRIQNDVKDETMYIGKTALNIILSNLISNAINYTYEKGMIQIGIEQDYFYIQNKQDPTQPKGNGLGLYIVRNLLDNYKMKYEVIEGEDFIFKIQFKQQVF